MLVNEYICSDLDKDPFERDVRVVKNLELTVAKIKNTGANLKDAFTSKMGKKRETKQPNTP